MSLDMVLYPFVASLTLDASSGNVVGGATGSVFAKADTTFTTPLAAVDASGNPVTLTSNANGVLPSFYVDGHTSVNWVSGSWVFPLVTSEPVEGPEGPAGVSVNGATATGDDLVFSLSNGATTPPVKLPTAPGGSDAGVASYILTPGTETEAALSAAIARNRAGACHIIVAGGQSNATQSDTTIPVAVADSRLAKWDGSNIVELPATETYLLPSFAREYAKTIPAGDWILVVPCAVGSSGFTSTSINPAPAGYHYYPSPGTWDRTLTADPNNFYAQMVSKTNAAKTAALGISSTVTVDALLWSQGEEDTPFLNQTQYAAKLDDLITTFRTDVGVPLLPVIVGSMVPEYAALRGQVNTANVAAALSATPQRNPAGFATAFAYGPEGLPKNGEVIHYSTAAQIHRGKLFMDGLYRARINRADTKPVPPIGLDLVREASGKTTLRWEPPYCRVTGYDVDFTFDGGTTWVPGVLDRDSRLKAVSAALPWENVQARVRTKSDGAVQLSAYAYSPTLGAYEKSTVGTAFYFVGGENIAAHTGAMTLYTAFTLPASGGEATVNARSNDSTRQLYLSAKQLDATDAATAVTGGGTLFANFAGNKATAGPHVNAAALAASGGSLTAKRGSDAAATVTGTAGAILAETVRVTAIGGATVHGSYLFRGFAHDAATMATIQETLRLRHGLTGIGPV